MTIIPQWIAALIAQWRAIDTVPGGCPKCGFGYFLPIAGAEPLVRCAGCRQPLHRVAHPLPKDSDLPPDDAGPERFVEPDRARRHGSDYVDLG